MPGKGYGIYCHEGPFRRSADQLGRRLRYMAQYENVLPIWGIQKEKELDEFLSYIDQPPVLDETLQKVIDSDIETLAGDFCRGCGYCMPCPVGIEINNCARMSLLLRRSPSAGHLSPEARPR